MRLLIILAALAIAAAPIAAQADGVERPQRPAVHHLRQHHRPPPASVPLAPPVPVGPETVTLSQAFFAGSSGGVGADVGTGYVGGGTIVVQTGGGGRAFAFASARASASAGAGGHFGGHAGGCGCH